VVEEKEPKCLQDKSKIDEIYQEFMKTENLHSMHFAVVILSFEAF
jgi:hypothetical protein